MHKRVLKREIGWPSLAGERSCVMGACALDVIRDYAKYIARGNTREPAAAHGLKSRADLVKRSVMSGSE